VPSKRVLLMRCQVARDKNRKNGNKEKTKKKQRRNKIKEQNKLP